jgi:hypothetical protein
MSVQIEFLLPCKALEYMLMYLLRGSIKNTNFLTSYAHIRLSILQFWTHSLVTDVLCSKCYGTRTIVYMF